MSKWMVDASIGTWAVAVEADTEDDAWYAAMAEWDDDNSNVFAAATFTIVELKVIA